MFNFDKLNIEQRILKVRSLQLVWKYFDIHCSLFGELRFSKKSEMSKDCSYPSVARTFEPETYKNV